MLNQKTILISIGIFIAVYLVLILPMFNGSQIYGDFYRKQGFNFFNNFGKDGFVVFEAHDDNGNDDTRVYEANKNLANAKGDVESVPYNISTRILGYLPTILMIALFAATPIKLWKRALLLMLGFVILHIFLMLFLYILILDKFITTPWLKMYQDMSASSKHIISVLNSSINHGMGLNNFLVVLIWLSLLFFFERNLFSSIYPNNSAETK